jgi:hypothetical protein
MSTQVLSPARDVAPGRWKTAGDQLRERLGNISHDARWAIAAVIAFLGVTVWWLSQDTVVPDWDSGGHALDSFKVYEEISHGHLTTPFTEFNQYPPVGHLVGALGVAVGGYSMASVILALNLVFVPVLAFACYGVGKRVAGTRAGLLAVVFALGTPMIISEAHEVYLDPLQTAFIALSVYLIFASQRFERWGVAAAAGAVTGLAMLTKQTTPVFLVGLLIVVIARGGWRHWRGLIAYFLALILVAERWYVYHLEQLHQLVIAHTTEANIAEANPFGGKYPALLSAKNLGWYFWDAANIQLRGPLLLLFGVGVIAATVSCVRRWAPENLYPELLAGAFVAWAGMTFLKHKDPRYDLPALIYVAVLATAWIPTLRLRWRRALTAGLVIAAALSFLSVAFGLGGSGYQIRVSLPGAHDRTALGARYITLYSTLGWLRGAPEGSDGNIPALLTGLRRDGARAMSDAGENRPDFNEFGLGALDDEAGLAHVAPAALGPKDAFVFVSKPGRGYPPPCQRLSDGTWIYAELGDPAGKALSKYTLVCPGRHPEIYGYQASPQP